MVLATCKSGGVLVLSGPPSDTGQGRKEAQVVSGSTLRLKKGLIYHHEGQKVKQEMYGFRLKTSN